MKNFVIALLTIENRRFNIAKIYIKFAIGINCQLDFWGGNHLLIY